VTPAKTRKQAAKPSTRGGASTGPTAAAPEPQGPVCMVDGCDRPVLHRGLCAEHWEDPSR
jgi:hypothetical protein